MRRFARSLALSAFALRVSQTFISLLPRLMPGDPRGVIKPHLSPKQNTANAGIIQTYQTLLGGGRCGA